jgi:hypothetical protein
MSEDAWTTLNADVAAYHKRIDQTTYRRAYAEGYTNGLLVGKRDCDLLHRGLIEAVVASARIRWRKRGRTEGAWTALWACFGLALVAAALGRVGRT